MNVVVADSVTHVGTSWLDHSFLLFQRGGPVMIPIALLSIIALGVIFERLFAFWQYNAANLYFRSVQYKLLKLTREGSFVEALECANHAHSPVCRILATALEHRETGLLETLEAVSQQELNRLRRGLSVLDTTITVAPMLGILGTVTGIINTFNMLDVAGLDNPATATAGIAEALITTAAGLIVAIICLFPFNFMVAQLKRRTTELEQIIYQFSQAFSAGLQQVNGTLEKTQSHGQV